MSRTEQQLVAAHSGPVIPLKDICKKYLNSSYAWARQKAVLHGLPFPAFKLDDTNNKSPWMVRATDLADFLDARGEAGAAAWRKSQL